MKTATYILVSLMLLNLNFLYAKEPVSPKLDGFETISIPLSLLSTLAPETPKEATFEDVAPDDTQLLLKSLAPVTPKEADFEDQI